MLRRSKADSRGANAPARVLVVDDNPDAAHLLGKLLRRAGYEVAEIGEHAVAVATLMAEVQPVSGVVSAFSTSGSAASLKLLDAIRNNADPKVNQVRMMIISDQERQQIFAWQAGVDEIVMRPYHAEPMTEALNRMVQRPDNERVAYRREQVARVKATVAENPMMATARAAPTFI